MKRFAPIALLLSAGLFAVGCGQQHSHDERAVQQVKHDTDRAAADADRAAADADRAAHAATDAAFRQGPVDPRAQDQNLGAGRQRESRRGRRAGGQATGGQAASLRVGWPPGCQKKRAGGMA